MTTLKMIVVGPVSVGKSALIVRLVKSYFLDEYLPTLEDWFTKQVVIDDETYYLNITDTAGLDECISDVFWNQALQLGNVLVLVFSLNDANSLEYIIEFKKNIMKIKDFELVPMILVGNKCDLERTVDMERVKNISEWYNIPFIETSAKTGKGVEDAFYTLVRMFRKDNPPKKKLKKSTNCNLL